MPRSGFVFGGVLLLVGGFLAVSLILSRSRGTPESMGGVPPVNETATGQIKDDLGSGAGELETRELRHTSRREAAASQDGDGIDKKDPPSGGPDTLSASETPEGWAQTYADASPGTMLGEAFDLETHILSVSRKELEDRYDLGMYELLSTDGAYVLQDEDSEIISNVIITGINDGSEVRKVVLPEAEFPDLYLMKQKTNWLRKEARSRKD